MFGYDSSHRVLNGVSFELPWDALVVVFGRSGVGKSTLLRCLGEFSTPASGLIEEGWRRTIARPVEVPVRTADNAIEADAAALVSLLRKIVPPSALAPQYHNEPVGRMLFAPQSSTWMMFSDSRNLLPHLSAAENLDLLLAPRSNDISLRNHIVDMVLEMLGVADVAFHLPSQLSTGQLRRVQLGQSLVGSFNVLLLDEPTSGLDSNKKYDLLELLRRIHLSVGLTGLVVTHDIETALLLADRIMFFGDGEIVEEVEVPTPGLRRPEELDSGAFRSLRHRMLRFLMTGQSGAPQ